MLNINVMKRHRDFTDLSGRRLKLLLGHLCERSQEDVSRLERYEEVATHQLRVRMKKILALLRLARAGIEPETMQALRLHIRAVKLACAGNRERTVRSKLIDKLVRRFHLSPKHRPHAEGKPPCVPSCSYLRHQLHALGLLIDSTCIESLSAGQVLEQYVRCYRQGRRLMKQACENTDNEVLHRWRHRVKDLYFQTLALRHLPGALRRIHRAKRLGNLLGRDQDLANLTHEPAFAIRRSPWRQVIGEHRESLRPRYLALGHKLYAPHVSRFGGGIFAHA